MIRLPLQVAFLLLCAGLVTTAHAQPGPADSEQSGESADVPVDSPPATALTPKLIDSKIREVRAATDLDDATKGKLIELYRKTLSSLEAADAFDTKAAAYTQSLRTAPAQAAEIRKALDAAQKAGEGPVEPLPKDVTVQELGQRLAKTQADAAAVEAKLTEMEKALENRAQRPTAARQRIIEDKKELDDLEAQMALPSSDNQSPLVTQAQRWARESHQRELRSEVHMLDQELLSQTVRTDLLEARRDKAAADLKTLRAEERKLEDQVNARRTAEAEEAQAAAEDAKRQAEGKHPLVQQLAQRNAALTHEITVLTTETGRLDDQRIQIDQQTKRISDEYRSARQRLEIAGLSQALGRVLIDQRNQLPDMRPLKKAAAKREQEIADATLRQIRLGEEQHQLRDIDAYVEGLSAGVPADAREAVQDQLRQLAKARKDLVEQALTTLEAYLNSLGELDYASSQLVDTIQTYDDFLSERLLWVRSALTLSLGTVVALPSAVAWMVSPGNWMEVGKILLYESAHSALFWLIALAAGILLWSSRTLRAAIRSTETPLRRVRTDRFLYTLQGLGLSLVLAAPYPLILALLGWQLYSSLEATLFTKCVGYGALSVSVALYYLRAFRVICMPGGVADRHFRWSGPVLATLRRSFDRLIFVVVPVGFVASAVYYHPDPAYNGSLGRLSLVLLLAAFGVFFARVLHPRQGALRNLLQAYPEGWLNRSRYVWYTVAIAAPVALIALTLAGYLYTAGTLLKSLVSSMYLVLALTVIHQLILRWLGLTRRRLALQGALARRATRAVQEQPRGDEDLTSAIPQLDEPLADLASLDERTRKLIETLLFLGGAVGLWVTWSDVLPAFGFLREIALWHHTAAVNGEQKIVPVTLADMILVLIVLFLAIVAGRNLPALLEILLLQRMSLSPGSRYAVKTLTGYAITAAAALVVFTTFGFSWSQVQWLVAALGVGIGFGLQEIVANFISGLIILLERPVRVGDIVTIGDTTGVVSRIRIRATTIRNWDKQELLVPNKEFITGRLLNWSLSDQLNRVIVNVGVAYGSDVKKALSLLTAAASENPRVVPDPPPFVTFDGFGDNSLNLILRCYLESLDYRLSVASELRQAINDKFAAANISIAFPQRDVHLDTSGPLEVRIAGRDGGSACGAPVSPSPKPS
jgi:potassium efflux system protein